MKNYQKKQLLIILILILCSISFVVTFGRYVTKSVNNFILRSKEFYFASDKMSEKGAVFQIDNWSGVDDYVITINMNSRKNNLQVSTYDIPYEITYNCSSNAICQIDKTSGIIPGNTNSDSFYLTITPNAQLETGDKVVINVEARSTGNYKKTIKGKFTLVVGKEKLTYKIEDKSNNPYMDLRITNTLSYYIVDQNFENYTKGQKIDIDTYLGLSEINKQKCYSNIVTIKFDPNKILLDITNENIKKATNLKTQNIGNAQYINSLTLSIDAISSADLRFYKVDNKKDYTYPNANNYSVVTITTK